MKTSETRKYILFRKIKNYELKTANITMKAKQFLKINLITGQVETLKFEVFLYDIIQNKNERNIVWLLVPSERQKKLSTLLLKL